MLMNAVTETVGFLMSVLGIENSKQLTSIN